MDAEKGLSFLTKTLKFVQSTKTSAEKKMRRLCTLCNQSYQKLFHSLDNSVREERAGRLTEQHASGSGATEVGWRVGTCESSCTNIGIKAHTGRSEWRCEKLSHLLKKTKKAFQLQLLQVQAVTKDNVAEILGSAEEKARAALNVQMLFYKKKSFQTLFQLKYIWTITINASGSNATASS